MGREKAEVLCVLKPFSPYQGGFCFALRSGFLGVRHTVRFRPTPAELGELHGVEQTKPLHVRGEQQVAVRFLIAPF